MPPTTRIDVAACKHRRVHSMSFDYRPGFVGKPTASLIGPAEAFGTDLPAQGAILNLEVFDHRLLGTVHRAGNIRAKSRK